MVTEGYIEINKEDAVRARWAAEAITSHHGVSSVRHETHPWVVFVDVRDSAASLQVTKHGHPHMLALTLSGFAGRAEGDLGLLSDFLGHCSRELPRN